MPMKRRWTKRQQEVFDYVEEHILFPKKLTYGDKWNIKEQMKGIAGSARVLDYLRLERPEDSDIWGADAVALEEILRRMYAGRPRKDEKKLKRVM